MEQVVPEHRPYALMYHWLILSNRSEDYHFRSPEGQEPQGQGDLLTLHRPLALRGRKGPALPHPW